MSLPREHKKSQIPWLDLGVFAVALGFLGYSLHAFLQPGARGAPAAPPPPAVTETPPPPARAPASQSGQTPGSTEVLKIPCLHEGSAPRELKSSARLLQIHSPLCGDDLKASKAEWKATNESSGEEILVFVNRKEKVLSTSYFTLKEGLNQLVFVEDLGKGVARTEKLRIERKAD